MRATKAEMLKRRRMILTMWNVSKLTAREIADVSGLSQDIVWRALVWARNEGMKVRDAPCPLLKIDRLAEILQLWNKQRKTQREIGEMLGLTRNAVGRLLCDARKRGTFVRPCTPKETIERRWRNVKGLTAASVPQIARFHR